MNNFQVPLKTPFSMEDQVTTVTYRELLKIAMESDWNLQKQVFDADPDPGTKLKFNLNLACEIPIEEAKKFLTVRLGPV